MTHFTGPRVRVATLLAAVVFSIGDQAAWAQRSKRATSDRDDSARRGVVAERRTPSPRTLPERSPGSLLPRSRETNVRPAPRYTMPSPRMDARSSEKPRVAPGRPAQDRRAAIRTENPRVETNNRPQGVPSLDERSRTPRFTDSPSANFRRDPVVRVPDSSASMITPRKAPAGTSGDPRGGFRREGVADSRRSPSHVVGRDGVGPRSLIPQDRYGDRGSYYSRWGRLYGSPGLGCYDRYRGYTFGHHRPGYPRYASRYSRCYGGLPYRPYVYTDIIDYPSYRFTEAYLGYVAYPTDYGSYTTVYSNGSGTLRGEVEDRASYSGRTIESSPFPGVGSDPTGENTGVVPPASGDPTVAPSPATDADASGQSLQEAAPGFVEQGHTLFAEGKVDEARQMFVRAVVADDQDGYAKLFYGLANFAAGDYAAATSAVRRALAVSPDLIGSPVDLRQFYKDATVLEGQMESLRRAVSERPDDREAGFLLGYMSFAIGQAEQARAALDPLTQSQPPDELAALVRDAVDRVLAAQGTTAP